jgi:hypothetical protein
MGYSTHFELTMEPEFDKNNHDLDWHKKAIGKLSGYDDALFDSGESWKWYEYEDHMTQHSRKHPDVVFRLDGEGEESTDIWRMWFKDGRSQRWDLEVNKPDKPQEPW